MSSFYADHQAGSVHVKTAEVARTDTTAKNLFKIPARAIITGFKYAGAAASDAATTATLSIGKTGSGTFHVNAANVKAAATGLGLVLPNAQNVGTILAAEEQVTAVYAETGAASTTGGPWTVIVEYLA